MKRVIEIRVKIMYDDEGPHDEPVDELSLDMTDPEEVAEHATNKLHDYLASAYDPGVNFEWPAADLICTRAATPEEIENGV